MTFEIGNCIRVTHGKARSGNARSRVYRIWAAARQRVIGGSDPKYIRYYRDRGVQMCREWFESFEAFYRDMGDPPAGLTLDRWPNKNGNYEPGNCRWATYKQQARNTRRNVIVEYGGLKMTLIEWSERTGINYSTLYRRFKLWGGDADRMFSQPVQIHRK